MNFGTKAIENLLLRKLRRNFRPEMRVIPLYYYCVISLKYRRLIAITLILIVRQYRC
jgi:hypothetical protein